MKGWDKGNKAVPLPSSTDAQELQRLKCASWNPQLEAF